MAKHKPQPHIPKPQAERDGADFSPAADDVAAAELLDAEAEAGTVADAEAEFEHPLKDDPAMKDARAAADEIARLRAENAELKATKVVPQFAPGQRYLVKLKDAASWVVEPEPGEHPFEAYKRATGCTGSANTPEIAPTAKPVGRAA